MLLDVLHPAGIPRPLDSPLSRRSIQLRVDIGTPFALRLSLLDDQGIRRCVRIMANARYLPGNLSSRCPAGNREVTSGNFLRYVQSWARLTNCRQLVTEVAVDGFEPGGQFDDCGAA